MKKKLKKLEEQIGSAGIERVIVTVYVTGEERIVSGKHKFHFKKRAEQDGFEFSQHTLPREEIKHPDGYNVLRSVLDEAVSVLMERGYDVQRPL